MQVLPECCLIEKGPEVDYFDQERGAVAEQGEGRVFGRSVGSLIDM